MFKSEFENLNASKGYHWFEPDSMKFFRTKVVFWDNVTGCFITSEVNPSRELRYTLRQADFVSGRVETIGEFHSHDTLREAKKAMKAYLAGLPQKVEEIELDRNVSKLIV